jgi:hypothetical protein
MENGTDDEVVQAAERDKWIIWGIGKTGSRIECWAAGLG